LIEKITGKKFE